MPATLAPALCSPLMCHDGFDSNIQGSGTCMAVCKQNQMYCRGGYCFETNALLAHVLRAAGFQIHTAAARVVVGKRSDHSDEASSSIIPFSRPFLSQSQHKCLFPIYRPEATSSACNSKLRRMLVGFV